MIPILDRLLYKPEEQKPLIRVLILVPTRNDTKIMEYNMNYCINS